MIYITISVMLLIQNQGIKGLLFCPEIFMFGDLSLSIFKSFTYDIISVEFNSSLILILYHSIPSNDEAEHVLHFFFFKVREAMRKDAGFRVWILFFLIVLSCTILFLDWYNAWSLN